MWYLLKRTADFIIEAARNNYPQEFAGMLRAEGNVLTEVLFIPGTQWNEHSAMLFLNMLPADLSVVGSVHSHPGPAIPSQADLEFFSKFGKIHLIVGYPYQYQDIHAFLPSGQEVEIIIK